MKKNGFSLIELMLVMVVFAVMGLYAVNMIKNRQNNLAISQTVTQFKNLLQQGALYQQNTQTLPTSSQDLTQANLIQPTDLCAIWAASNSGNSACPQKANFQVSSQGESIIVVSLTLPAIEQNVASAIASQIPAGQVDPRTNTISAYQTIQVQPERYTENPSANVFGYITNAGFAQCNNKSYDDNPSTNCDRIPLASPGCPNGYEGHFVLSPYQFSSDRRQYYSGFFSTTSTKEYYIMSFNAQGTVLNPQSDNPSIVVSDASKIITLGNNTSYGANIAKSQYLVMCLPARHWSSATSNIAYSIGSGQRKSCVTRAKLNCSKILCPGAGQCVGQCDTNWYRAYPCKECGTSGNYPQPLNCGVAPANL